MKVLLINLLKKYRWIYRFYYYFFNSILQLLGLLIKADSNIILFVCSGGKRYSDNVPPVYELILNDHRFDEWKIIWALRDVKSVPFHDKKRTVVVKIDSLKYYFYALKAKCWITNVSVQRGLNFKNKGTIYVNTWHGVPIKHIGLDNDAGFAFTLLEGSEEFDLLCAMGSYDKPIMMKAFALSDAQVKITGYPRNDIMFSSSIEDCKKRVSEYLEISYEKKIILYAPTFRDYKKDLKGAYTFDFNVTKQLFDFVNATGYQLLVRAHPALLFTNASDLGIIDASKYPNVEDLLMVSDILITDYSGIMFDFALLEKPILCYPYDLEEYEEKRGLYFEYESFMPFQILYNQKDLCEAINNLDYNAECHLTKMFKEKCGLIGEGASQNVVNEIWKLLEQN